MAEEWEQVPRHAAQPHLVRDTGGQSSQVPGRHAGGVHTGQPEEPDSMGNGQEEIPGNMDILFTIYVEAIVPAEYSALPCPCLTVPRYPRLARVAAQASWGREGEYE